jgi:hypothetical protein
LTVGRLASAVLAVVAFCFCATYALAATVVIVRPATSSPAMAETVVRLRGELISAGFGVELVDASAVGVVGGQESRAALERLVEQHAADAAVAIVGDLSPNSVEVWVVDRLTGKSVIRRLPFEPQSGRAPQTLAIRAIELLRSSFLEIHLAPGERGNQPPAQPSPTVVRFVAMEPTAGRPERVGVEVGAAAVMGFDGVGVAVLPVVRFDWAVRPWLVTQAAFAGLGTRPSVAAGLGSAQVAQEYGVVGACYRWRSGARVRPFLSLSMGALHTSIEGRANPGNESHSDSQWSLLFDGGLGTWLQLRDRFYLAIAAHVQMADPYVGVRFVDTVVATSARPNVLLTFTVGAWL